jgi:hypothetical protein
VTTATAGVGNRTSHRRRISLQHNQAQQQATRDGGSRFQEQHDQKTERVQLTIPRLPHGQHVGLVALADHQESGDRAGSIAELHERHLAEPALATCPVRCPELAFTWNPFCQPGSGASRTSSVRPGTRMHALRCRLVQSHQVRKET